MRHLIFFMHTSLDGFVPNWRKCSHPKSLNPKVISVGSSHQPIKQTQKANTEYHPHKIIISFAVGNPLQPLLRMQCK